jgi:3-isopropylmalate/(R)-2-methylmalate dehydratase small subunit
MEKFNTLNAVATPLRIINIDTDMIIPKQFLKTIHRTGLGKNLFDEMRYLDDGSEKKDFILNQQPYRNAEILIAGDNFGCGSSREHAPWALLDFGIRCVIAPSFADIFYNNCFQNGILPMVLPNDQIEQLLEALNASSDKKISINLPEQKVICGNQSFHFDIDEFRKECLLEGLDNIGLTLKNDTKITTFEDHRKQSMGWL